MNSEKREMTLPAYSASVMWININIIQSNIRILCHVVQLV